MANLCLSYMTNVMALISPLFACQTKVFYGSILSEFLRIARASMLLNDFITKAIDLVKRMYSQDGNIDKILSQIRRAGSRHPEHFLKSLKVSPR